MLPSNEIQVPNRKLVESARTLNNYVDLIIKQSGRVVPEEGDWESQMYIDGNADVTGRFIQVSHKENKRITTITIPIDGNNSLPKTCLTLTTDSLNPLDIKVEEDNFLQRNDPLRPKRNAIDTDTDILSLHLEALKLLVPIKISESEF